MGYASVGFCQADVFPGKWEMAFVSKNDGLVIRMELNISTSEKNILYPAEMKIKCDGFSGTYKLLLVKKNNIELGISRNKYPISETPFSLGSSTAYLNNIFSLNKDRNGVSILVAERLFSKRFNTILADTFMYPDSVKQTAASLKEFLMHGDIILKKINDAPMLNQKNKLSLTDSSAYFGILDTVHFHTKAARILFSVNPKKVNDTISVMLNNISVAGDVDTRRNHKFEDIELDPGLNILTLFADNYGKVSPNTSRINIMSGDRKISMDFNKIPDQYATFIVVQIYYIPGKEDSIKLTNKYNSEVTNKTLQNFKEYKKYTLEETRDFLKRPTKTVGQINTKSDQITLALWDDAVEDGDSISLNINGKWLVQGLAVKKQTQFLTIALEPGPNKIVFIADNLGSISPNTSVLEIIDGRQRKSFKIDTDLGRNNKINIFYDFNPDK